MLRLQHRTGRPGHQLCTGQRRDGRLAGAAKRDVVRCVGRERAAWRQDGVDVPLSRHPHRLALSIHNARQLGAVRLEEDAVNEGELPAVAIEDQLVGHAVGVVHLPKDVLKEGPQVGKIVAALRLKEGHRQ
eukprot:5696148-Prymnesium_polylepis.3